jgi:hypothetical protein
MWRWLMAVLGAAVGGAVGLFGPVLAFVALGMGSGSYEDVLPVWLASLPLGVALGAWLGHRLGRRFGARRDGDLH